MRCTRKRRVILCSLVLVLCAGGGCQSWLSQGPMAAATPGDLPAPVLRETPRSERVVSRVTVQPAEVIAAVGSDMPLSCSVCEEGNYLAGQRVDWALSAESVGEFVTAPQLAAPGAADVPQPQSSRTATSVTSGQYEAVGGAAQARPGALAIQAQGGQALVVVRSQAEGTSYVTAFAPTGDESPSAAPARQQTAVIHWVDAEWIFPDAASEPAGTSHVFTTTLRRRTDQQPRPGWIVRYKLAGGAAAGFAPDNAQRAEIVTGANGQASVEITQPLPAIGTTQVQIELVRPAEAGGRELVVARGTTHVAWTADLGLRVTGPAEAAVGETAKYLIEVANPGRAAAKGAVINLVHPAIVAFVESSPDITGQDRARRLLQWQLGDIAPGGRASIELSLRARQRGSVSVCATLHTADGLKAEQCADTAFTGPKIEVSMQSPKDVKVGDEVTFLIRITNAGPSAVDDLVLVDDFEAGLKHPSGPTPIRKRLGTLVPGETHEVGATFEVVALKDLCNRVEVQGPAGPLAAVEGCATAAGLSTTEPPPARPGISVRKTAPERAVVGETVTLVTRVTNTGNVDLVNVVVADRYPAELEPVEATDGFTPRDDAGRHELVWTIPRIPAGASAIREVKCRCRATGPHCGRVVVSAAGAAVADEACVEVRLPDDALELSVTDITKTVAVGGTAIFRITVRNTGSAPQKQVRLQVTLPQDGTLVRAGTRPPEGLDFTDEGRTVTFSPLAELKAGDEAAFRIAVRVTRAGTATLQATVRSEKITVPLRAEDATLVTNGGQ
ncbi:MAG: DUF11 domain-containing protein [Planctomycetia bacterium]|nr:DUF11 domain-containing protein [Planctomycetia bacterium]